LNTKKTYSRSGGISVLNYCLPDKKLTQDIVSNFEIAAGFIRKFYYEDAPTDAEPEGPFVGHDRYARGVADRYQRQAIRS